MVNDKEVVVELKNITKKFGNFIANENISFKLLKGQVHAILGENGAGKSTLMNQLFGLLQPTSGEIYVHGKLKKFSSAKDAMNEGIGMVHQHFMLIESFTVTENIILGFEPVNGITLDMEKAKQLVNEISKKYDFKIDVSAKICDISVEMQQKVEILKSLVRGADILIFDEPTACLTPNEIDKFMENIKKLTKDGKSIIIITHKLKEIKKCADVCTIIRQGKYIDTVNVQDKSEDELAELMVGRKVVLDVNKSSHPDLDVVLDVKNVFAKDYRKIDILKKISFVVKKGEIVGLAGIDGNGQAELVDVITGLKKATSGEVLLNGENIINTTSKNCFEKGVSSIPADRQKRGLILDFEVRENMILQNYQTEKFSKNGILDNEKIDFFTNKAIEKYDIRPKDCINKLASTLSGGNQQKIIIAREVENNKDLLIAYNPTRGLDIGAIEFVHKYLVEQREKGKAILLVSYDLEEILTLSDRILVIFDGKIVGNILGKDANEKKLGILMAGGVL